MGKTRYAIGRLDSDASRENVHSSTTHLNTAKKVGKLNAQAKRIASRGQNFKPALKRANATFDRSWGARKRTIEGMIRETK